MHTAKIAIKVAIGFMFSLNIAALFVLVFLLGTQADDKVSLIVTEATSLQREMLVFQIDLNPPVIQNLFLVGLAALGFMLILLYYVEHSFRPLLAPGLLLILITVTAYLIIFLSQDQILAFAGQLGDLYLETALARFRQAALGGLFLGAILVFLSYRGDRFSKKAREQQGK